MESWDASLTNRVTFPGEPRLLPRYLMRHYGLDDRAPTILTEVGAKSDVACERQLRRNADGSLRIDPYRNGAAGTGFGNVPATERGKLQTEELR